MTNHPRMHSRTEHASGMLARTEHASGMLAHSEHASGMHSHSEHASGMHGPSPILGPDGRAARRYLSRQEQKDLGKEIARPELIGVRTLYSESIASGLTPERIAALLMESRRGDTAAWLELAEEMEERDLHYYSMLATRKRALSQLKGSVAPSSAPGADEKIADAVRAVIDAPIFRDMLRDLTDAFGKGYSAVEIMWGCKDGLWGPAAYCWRDPKYFTFDYVSRSELRLAQEGAIDGVVLPRAKFIIHKPKLKSGVPIRSGFARLAIWAWLFKAFTLKDWAQFLDVFGMPIRLGKYHPSATADERRTLLRAVSSIASDAAAIIPESMAIELIEVKGQSGGAPFEAFGRYLDEQVSKAILGQTMTTDAGGSRAQAQVHEHLRYDILEDDADQLAATLNRDLIAWFVALNFGEAAPTPWIGFPVAKPDDVAALADAVGTLVPLGLRVSQAEIRNRLGLREPAETEEILTAPTPLQNTPLQNALLQDAPLQDAPLKDDLAHNRLKGCPCCGVRTAHNRREEKKREETAVPDEEDWEPVMEPIRAQILGALEDAQNFDDFKRRLTALSVSLDMQPLADRLTTATVHAREAGRKGKSARATVRS